MGRLSCERLRRPAAGDQGLLFRILIDPVTAGCPNCGLEREIGGSAPGRRRVRTTCAFAAGASSWRARGSSTRLAGWAGVTGKVIPATLLSYSVGRAAGRRRGT